VSSTLVPRTARIACLALLTLLALGAAAARAQNGDVMVYRMKFTCGFAGGNIPDSGSQASVLPVPYREVQPGNYSTAINILNAQFSAHDASIVAQVFTEGRPTPNLPSFTLTSSTAVTIDCADITSRLATVGFNNDGRFVEGFVMFIADDTVGNQRPNLEVDVVYTYGSRRTDNSGTGLGSSMQVQRIEGSPETVPE